MIFSHWLYRKKNRSWTRIPDVVGLQVRYSLSGTRIPRIATNILFSLDNFSALGWFFNFVKYYKNINYFKAFDWLTCNFCCLPGLISVMKKKWETLDEGGGGISVKIMSHLVTFWFGNCFEVLVDKYLTNFFLGYFCNDFGDENVSSFWNR